MGDNTYLKQPKFMDDKTFSAFIDRLKIHSEKHKLNTVFISFHGGEPLLAEKRFYSTAVEYARKSITNTEVIFTIQTNGTLLTEEWCQFLKTLDIQVSISIDGPKQLHDLFRVYHSTKGSFEDVIKGIEMRNKYGKGGIISVANKNVAAGELYQFYKSLSIERINILLPDINFSNCPQVNKASEITYGDWLIDLYKSWKNDHSTTKPNIAFLRNIVNLILGFKNAGDELLGKLKNGAVTIETDGAIEVVDPLRICRNGMTRNSLSVFSNEIDDICLEPLFELYYNSHEFLCNKCKRCLVENICGGGYLGHRYSTMNGFDNPSIYCSDLMKLITFIQNDLIDSMPEKLAKELDIYKVSFEEVLGSISDGKDDHDDGDKYLSSFSLAQP